MTKICFFKKNGVYYGFEESGHAGFAEEGNDILCAAISAMTMLVINAIEVGFASRVDYTIDEKTTNIKVIAQGALPEHETDATKRFAISGLLSAYCVQLHEMLEDYYDFLDVSEVETD